MAERDEVNFFPTDAAPESSIPDVCPTDAVDSVAAQESSIDLVETTIDPNQMKVKELKDWLRKKNLPTLGSKSLLIERVREAMKAGKRRVSFTFVSDDVTESIGDVEKNKRRREHIVVSDDDTGAVAAKRIRRGADAAAAHLDNTTTTLSPERLQCSTPIIQEDSMVTRIRNRMRKGRNNLSKFLAS